MTRTFTKSQGPTTVDATITIPLVSGFEACQTKIVEIAMTGFSGTLDIQGSVGTAAAKVNIRYNIIPDTAYGHTAAQLSYTTQTRIERILIPEPWPNIDLVFTQSAGSLILNVFGIQGGIGKFLES